MNKAVSFSNCGQIRSRIATGTKTNNQLIEGFSNDFMFIIHQAPKETKRIDLPDATQCALFEVKFSTAIDGAL